MSQLFAESQSFYPCHPSPEKTHQIQTTPSPMLEDQTKPFDVRDLRESFDRDPVGTLTRCQDKRFDVTGTAIWVGMDPHNLPTVQLSDVDVGTCYAHCIFPQNDILEQVHAGDRVTIRSNYLVLSRRFGVVMKCSELLSVERG